MKISKKDNIISVSRLGVIQPSWMKDVVFEAMRDTIDYHACQKWVDGYMDKDYTTEEDDEKYKLVAALRDELSVRTVPFSRFHKLVATGLGQWGKGVCPDDIKGIWSSLITYRKRYGESEEKWSDEQIASYKSLVASIEKAINGRLSDVSTDHTITISKKRFNAILALVVDSNGGNNGSWVGYVAPTAFAVRFSRFANVVLGFEKPEKKQNVAKPAMF